MISHGGGALNKRIALMYALIPMAERPPLRTFDLGDGGT